MPAASVPGALAAHSGRDSSHPARGPQPPEKSQQEQSRFASLHFLGRDDLETAENRNAKCPFGQTRTHLRTLSSRRIFQQIVGMLWREDCSWFAVHIGI